jgi:hypothetical protein
MLHALAMSVFHVILTSGKMPIQKNKTSYPLVYHHLHAFGPSNAIPPPTMETPIYHLLLGNFEIHPFKTYTFTLNQNGTINLLKRNSERALIVRSNNVPSRSKS